MDSNNSDYISKGIELSVTLMPTSILGIYTQYLKSSADGKAILVHGIFQRNATDIFSDGFYIDSLKSDRENLSIAIKTNAEIRTSLKDNSVYLLMGIIEENISFEKVELIFFVTRIIGEFETQLIPCELKKVSIELEGNSKRNDLVANSVELQATDLKKIIKDCLTANKSIHVLMITGDKILIPAGFKKALGHSIQKLTITVLHSLGMNQWELNELVKGSVNKPYDIIVLSGTWWNKHDWACNNQRLIDVFKKSNTCIVTVYGYNRQKTLLDKVSDKQFRSLNHFGSRLKVLIESANKL